MASKNTVLPLLRRELRFPSRFPRSSPTSTVPAIANLTRQSALSRAFGTRVARRTALGPQPTQARAFSQSISKRFTDENGEFDPRALERESDDVDVCIVGGGMSVLYRHPSTQLNFVHRSRRSRRRNSVEAACQRGRQ